jgi:hypothetical protein
MANIIGRDGGEMAWSGRREEKNFGGNRRL